MPFPDQIPKAFDQSTIEAFPADQTGVYGLFRGDVMIYIGKGDIRQRLLDHLNGDNDCITGGNPTSWYFNVVQGDPSDEEKKLIQEYDPVCNKRAG